MSLSDATLLATDGAHVVPAPDHDLVDAAERLVASLDEAIAAGQSASFPDETMRRLMTALVRIYATKFDEGQRPSLLAAESGVSATAVLVTTSALMKASNLEIFELGMWQSWSGTR